MERETFHEDGTPNLDPWKHEILTDIGCITSTLRFMGTEHEPASAQNFAYMLKEARRMESDIYRMGKHAGFSRDEIDAVGPL